MTEGHRTTTVRIVVVLLVFGALAGVMTDLYPGIAFLVAAVVVAVTQRRTLAGVRVPDSKLRRRRLTIAAFLGAIFLTFWFVAWDWLIGPTWTMKETAITIVGVSALFGSIGFLIGGLLTPKSAKNRVVAPTG